MVVRAKIDINPSFSAQNLRMSDVDTPLDLEEMRSGAEALQMSFGGEESCVVLAHSSVRMHERGKKIGNVRTDGRVSGRAPPARAISTTVEAGQ